MSIEVMKQALDALQSCSSVPHWPALQPTITALRIAIEQAEDNEADEWYEKTLRDERN
jgi:hypothetical protein